MSDPSTETQKNEYLAAGLMASRTSLSDTLELRSKPGASWPVTEQPDGARNHGEIYVQVMVLSKKVGTKDDGTIILSPLSESLVSYPSMHTLFIGQANLIPCFPSAPTYTKRGVSNRLLSPTGF